MRFPLASACRGVDGSSEVLSRDPEDAAGTTDGRAFPTPPPKHGRENVATGGWRAVVFVEGGESAGRLESKVFWCGHFFGLGFGGRGIAPPFTAVAPRQSS